MVIPSLVQSVEPSAFNSEHKEKVIETLHVEKY